jgi:hypothetical protein
MQVLPYLLIAAGLAATLALFLALKREIGAQGTRQKMRIEEMVLRLKEAERPAPPVILEAPAPFVPAPLRAGLNLSKRVHALRMLRRGEDVSHIAAALGVPRQEVELLVRVQTIGRARVATSSSDQS